MNKLTLDDVLRSRLKDLSVEVEVCDTAGQTVGFFVPAERHRELLYAWAKTLVTDEELEQARQEIQTRGSYTTAEAIAYLDNITRA
jgi:hypothetical protein